MSTTIAKANPKVGFVSLGCPKALVDSERILTQLRMEGYDVVSTYQDADVVVVNTCGFIDSAKAESLEVIGEAIKENGKAIVTGCMGGLMCEFVCNEVPLVLKQGELYVSSAFAGAASGVLASSLGLQSMGVLGAAMAVTVILRAGSLAFGWCLPIYKHEPPKS